MNVALTRRTVELMLADKRVDIFRVRGVEVVKACRDGVYIDGELMSYRDCVRVLAN